VATESARHDEPEATMAPPYTPVAPSAALEHERPAPENRIEPQEDREERTVTTTETSLSSEQLAAEGKRWTEQMLAAMGFEAQVSARAEGDRVDVTAEVSANEDLLTGPKGEVRQALQHLLNRMVNRGEGSRYHLQLEINDFWQRREKELEDLARSMAEDAVTSGDEIVSEYLNAQERRIIHVTLREDARVKTYALGTGMIKRIAVAPAGFDSGPRDDS
jgi:spoIIIJ-associated protein